MNNAIQIARLLDGIGNIDLTEDQMSKLSERVGLQPLEIKHLLDRASKHFSLSPIKSPLGEAQISEQLAEEGKISAVIPIDFNELLGKMDEDTIEELGTEFIEKMVGDSLDLSDLDYNVLYAEDNTLYVQVTGAASDGEE